MKRLFLFVFLCSIGGAQLEARRPNIILIMADDVGIDGLSCYGSDTYQTPHLDKLAASGMRFTHAYSQPLCTPTRVQIMTGKYNQRNWLYFGILDPKERTFGHLLQDAGYKTCIVGKWQLHSYDPPDFPNAAKRRSTGMRVDQAGFDEYALFHSWHTEDKGSRYANPTFDHNGKLRKDLKGKYGPDLSVEILLDFMKRHRKEEMFVYYPMALPHWPMVPTPDSEEWKDESRRLEESTDYFPDMVHYMDKLVGRIVAGVAELGLTKDTIIMFYSDNGTHLKITARMNGKEVKGGKATPLQTGIRVPLIASWPGRIKAGAVNGNLIDASDFVPTLAALAGTKAPKGWHLDGISFAQQLLGVDDLKRDWCFFWYDPRPGWDKFRFRRHIFALDHNYKLFSDGRLFDIKGTDMREVAVKEMTKEAARAKRKLGGVIARMMQPPISDAARKVVDAYGNEVR